MTGKFRDYNNWIYKGIPMTLIIFLPLYIVVAPVLGQEYAFLLLILYLIWCVLSIPLDFLFTYGSFAADEEKVVFRLGFITYTYKYSEIKFAETQTGFSHGRYDSGPYVKIDIYLKGDNDPKTFYDRIPNEALSTPEKHKKFLDEHRFTALCSFINERVSRNLY